MITPSQYICGNRYLLREHVDSTSSSFEDLIHTMLSGSLFDRVGARERENAALTLRQQLLAVAPSGCHIPPIFSVSSANKSCEFRDLFGTTFIITDDNLLFIFLMLSYIASSDSLSECIASCRFVIIKLLAEELLLHGETSKALPFIIRSSQYRKSILDIMRLSSVGFTAATYASRCQLLFVLWHEIIHANYDAMRQRQAAEMRHITNLLQSHGDSLEISRVQDIGMWCPTSVPVLADAFEHYFAYQIKPDLANQERTKEEMTCDALAILYTTKVMMNANKIHTPEFIIAMTLMTLSYVKIIEVVRLVAEVICGTSLSRIADRFAFLDQAGIRIRSAGHFGYEVVRTECGIEDWDQVAQFFGPLQTHLIDVFAVVMPKVAADAMNSVGVTDADMRNWVPQMLGIL